MSSEPRGYPRLVTLVLCLFLLLSDWVLLGGSFLGVRRVLVAAVALAALPFVLRNWRAVGRAVLAPPLAFFAAFLAVGLALAPAAISPSSAALHTLAFGGLTLFAVAVAGTLSLAATLTVVRVTLAVKLLGSLILGVLGGRFASSGILGHMPGNLFARHSFGGLFGNPNPLCDAAALYLLLVACHLIERGRQRHTRRRQTLEMAWYALTLPVAAYLMWQSLSRSAWISLVLVAFLLGFLALLRTPAVAQSRPRRALLFSGAVLVTLVAGFALLFWLNASRGLVKPGEETAGGLWRYVTSGAILDTSRRPLFWDFALDRIRERPWMGYGMSLTPSVFAPLGVGPEHSHNLELEAALYAGIPAALLIVLFVASSLKAAAGAFLARSPLSLSVAATLFFFYLLAQVEPLILGSPYPTLPIALILAVHIGRPRQPEM